MHWKSETMVQSRRFYLIAVLVFLALLLLLASSLLPGGRLDGLRGFRKIEEHSDRQGPPGVDW